MWLLAACLATSAAAQSNASIAQAVTRSLPILQKSAAEFVAQRSCVSCHHNALPILVLHAAQTRGFAIDAKVREAVEEKTFRELRKANALDDAIQGVNVADPTPNDSYLLMAARAAGLPPDMVTAVYARRMARWQRDGHWITSDFRPPHSSSLFTATATAVLSIQSYMPVELSVERDNVVRSARTWLLATPPKSTEDAAFRLMGLAWAGATAEELRPAVRDLMSLQKTNGGWPQLPGYDADAYSTGEAVFALHEARVPIADAARQRGVKFLLSSQSRDGTWRVRSRMLSPATVSPPYFPTGFPYKKDEFLSYAGTSWAVLALLSALPETSSASPPAAIAPDSPNPVPWLRTALFGTPQELEALLNAGLDPNSRTPKGTTLLMAAAPDAEKVRVLLARRADPRVRTESGVDALTAATSYYGAAPSANLLLDTGASAEPPDGVTVRRLPLVFASMSGDLTTVQLLLKRGATPVAEALAEAVTFGHPEVVRTLIAAGADSSIRERTGVNLMHWATITNRAAVIPVLAAAKVPLDDTDDSGFTPLMYAAAVDQGNSDTLKELLKAGADRRVRNLDGRTAADLARRFKHAALADALK
jgi:ankyrin repeat protein